MIIYCQCNRDCQVAHWEHHKLRCKQLQHCKQTSKENNQKRLFKLFQQWKDGSREVMVDAFYDLFGWTTLQQMQSERLVIHVKVEFDYNSFTFVPTELPIILPVDGAVEPPTNAQIHSLYDEARDCVPPSHVPQGWTFAPVISYLSYDNGKRALIQTNMVEYRGKNNNRTISLPDIVGSLQKKVQLTSRKLQKWMPKKQANLKLQVDTLCNSEHLKNLLIFSFQIFSAERRSLFKNAMVIFIEEGLGLGEIQSLTSHKVIKAKAAKDLYRSKISSSESDTSDSSGFVMSQFNNKTAATILFLGRTMCHVASINVDDLMAMKTHQTNEDGGRDSDENDQTTATAEEAFEKLCNVCLPKVTNPPLH